MRSLLSSFKELLFYSADQKKPAHYKAWSERLRKVTLSRLLPLFCNLKDSIEDSLRRDYMDQVCDILKGLDDSSSLDCEYSAEAGETAIVQAKQSLLELWHHLLDCIEKVPVADVNPIIFSVILWIMKRPEFDLTHLRWDATTHAPTCEHHVLIMAYRYRRLLLSTLSYVVRNLNAFAEAYLHAASPRPAQVDTVSAASPPSTSSNAGTGGLDTLVHQDDEDEELPSPRPFSDVRRIDKVLSENERDLITSLDVNNNVNGNNNNNENNDNNNNNNNNNKDENKDGDVGEKKEIVDASVPSEGGEEVDDDCGPIFKYTPKVPLSPPPQRSKSRKKIVPINNPSTDTLYGSLPQPFAVFSAKTLAFLYFRFPAIQDTIIRASLSNYEGPNPEEYGLKRPESAYPPEKCPLLFQWDIFHESVKKWNNDTKVDTINHLPKTWLLFLSTRVEFFVEFYVEWICCACNRLKTHETTDWLSVPGYIDLTLAYFSLYSLPPSAPRPPPRYFFSCENLMLNTAVPLVLENVVRFHFCRTRVSDTAQVNECLSFFESWLITLTRAKASIGNDFDATVLCAGIDGLLATDHHLVLSKVLALFYNYAWVFHDNPRLGLFGDVLLDKHFYHLFLHWDENVRNLFMQFLLFRLLTCKRRDVVSAEIAMSTTTSSHSPQPADDADVFEIAESFAKSESYNNNNKENNNKDNINNNKENKDKDINGINVNDNKVKPENADFVLIHKVDGYIWAIGECAKKIISANAAAGGRTTHRKSVLRRQSLDRRQQQQQQGVCETPRFVKGKKVYVTEEAPAPIVVSMNDDDDDDNYEEEDEDGYIENYADNESAQTKPKEANIIILEEDNDENDENKEEEIKDENNNENNKNEEMSSKYSFTAPPVPENLKIYIDRSLREFKKHLSRYEDWEAKTKDEPPKLLLYPSY